MASKYQCKNIAGGHTTVNLSSVSLLKWVNDLLGTEIQNVEELRSGSAYCQLLDMLFPGCIPLMKVNFAATQTHEFWVNLKYVEAAFHAIGCEKELPIDDLVRGEFQANFEFLQWFKIFYDVNLKESVSSIIPKPEPGLQTSSKGPKMRSNLTLQPDKFRQAEIEREMPEDGLPLKDCLRWCPQQTLKSDL